MYFPDRVVPMLPEALSNGWCSLKPREDRGCVFVEMRFDADGGIRACLSFLRLGGALAGAHPAALAEDVAVNALLSTPLRWALRWAYGSEGRGPRRDQPLFRR